MTVHTPCFIRALQNISSSILMFNCTVKAQNKQWLHLGSPLNSFKICTTRSMNTLSWNTLRKSHRMLVTLKRESTECSQEESPPETAKGLLMTLLSPHPGRNDVRLKSMTWWGLPGPEACCGRLASIHPDYLQTVLFSGWMIVTPVTGKTRWHLLKLVAEGFRHHNPHSIFMLIILITFTLSIQQVASSGLTILSPTPQYSRCSNKGWNSNHSNGCTAIPLVF